MSSLEIAAFSSLWAILLALASLVLLLYRQVDKSYAAAIAGAKGALPAGTKLRPLEVISPDGIGSWATPEDDLARLVVFVSAGCQACTDLLRTLGRERPHLPETTTFVVGEAHGDFAAALQSVREVLWLAHPPDAVRDYGISSFPLVYAVRAATVLASRSVSSKSGLERLLREAQAGEHALDVREDTPSEQPATSAAT